MSRPPECDTTSEPPSAQETAPPPGRRGPAPSPAQPPRRRRCVPAVGPLRPRPGFRSRPCGGPAPGYVRPRPAPPTRRHAASAPPVALVLASGAGRKGVWPARSRQLNAAVEGRGSPRSSRVHLLLFLFLFLQAPVRWTRGLQRRPHSQGQRSKRGGDPGTRAAGLPGQAGKRAYQSARQPQTQRPWGGGEAPVKPPCLLAPSLYREKARPSKSGSIPVQSPPLSAGCDWGLGRENMLELQSHFKEARRPRNLIAAIY